MLFYIISSINDGVGHDARILDSDTLSMHPADHALEASLSVIYQFNTFAQNDSRSSIDRLMNR